MISLCKGISMEDRYIRVRLDTKATIIKFECNLPNVAGYTDMEVVGENWFDMFIDHTDNEAVMSTFKSLFNHSKDWVSYENDITCKDGKHKLVNFHNKLVEIEGITYLDSIGVEHYNANTLLSIVAKVTSRS